MCFEKLSSDNHSNPMHALWGHNWAPVQLTVTANWLEKGEIL